jgi:hypothetical protein
MKGMDDELNKDRDTPFLLGFGTNYGDGWKKQSIVELGLDSECSEDSESTTAGKVCDERLIRENHTILNLHNNIK